MRQADIVVVGAGSAGAVMAARLSEDAGRTVVLVEAGADTPPGAVPADIRDTFPSSYANPGYFWPGQTAAMRAGADDYLVKPFDLEELLARVRAQIRRLDDRTGDTISCANVCLDLAARTATLDGEPVALTAKEFRVLAHLMRKSGKFINKQELEDALYDDSAGVESNTIEVTIYALRRKLGPRFITTGRGLGYMVSR